MANMQLNKTPMPEQDPVVRSGNFKEVALGYTAEQAVNEAKRCFPELSPLNLYFSTIDAGLTIDKEPEGEPDWGHYDALCEIQLGYMFADHIIQSYGARG